MQRGLFTLSSEESYETGPRTVTELTIDKVELERKADSGSTRVTFTVLCGDKQLPLWFSVERAFEDAICGNRADPVLVAILPFLVRDGFKRVISKVPISRELYYRLQNHVIPQLSNGTGGSDLQIEAPSLHNGEPGAAVAAGMSLGIDSFATLNEYSNEFAFPEYRVSHLTYFNVGAHHGHDVELGSSELTSRQLYEGQLRRARDFGNEFGYPLIEVDSNVSSFLRRAFGRSLFSRTHTYRNVAASMVLQNLIGTYFYSSAFNLNQFEVSLSDGDSAAYEKWLLPNLETGSLRFFSSNRAWTRFEKTKRVSEMPESFNYLTVCLLGVENCGRCAKCRKTLMMLDVLGDDVLNRYRASFDLEAYKGQHRDLWFGKIYSLMRMKGVHGADMRELFRYGIGSSLPAKPTPPRGRILDPAALKRVLKGGCNVRELPNLRANISGRLEAGSAVKCVGKYYNWFRISGSDGEGFIRADRLAPAC